MAKRVLILCTGNSCRSQIAQAFWNEVGQGEWQAESAGSQPSGYVHPLAIRVMAESGIDIGSHRSKSMDQFREQDFDLVVTVCDHARQACPTFPGAVEALHWPFDDPADAEGSEAEQLSEFRRIRDQIRSKINDYLLPDA